MNKSRYVLYTVATLSQFGPCSAREIKEQIDRSSHIVMGDESIFKCLKDHVQGGRIERFKGDDGSVAFGYLNDKFGKRYPVTESKLLKMVEPTWSEPAPPLGYEIKP